MNAGAVAIVCAAISVGVGVYGEYQQISEQTSLLGGLAGLLALGAAVLWWAERAKRRSPPPR